MKQEEGEELAIKILSNKIERNRARNFLKSLFKAKSNHSPKVRDSAEKESKS